MKKVINPQGKKSKVYVAVTLKGISVGLDSRKAGFRTLRTIKGARSLELAARKLARSGHKIVTIKD